jgi:hypothetical protein
MAEREAMQRAKVERHTSIATRTSQLKKTGGLVKKPIILCIVTRPKYEHLGAAKDSHIYEMIEKARHNHTLLELHNLAVEQTAEYASGCLYVIAATAIDHPEAAKEKFGLMPSSFIEFVFELSSGNPNFIELVVAKMCAEDVILARVDTTVIQQSLLIKHSAPDMHADDAAHAAYNVEQGEGSGDDRTSLAGKKVTKVCFRIRQEGGSFEECEYTCAPTVKELYANFEVPARIMGLLRQQYDAVRSKPLPLHHAPTPPAINSADM